MSVSIEERCRIGNGLLHFSQTDRHGARDGLRVGSGVSGVDPAPGAGADLSPKQAAKLRELGERYLSEQAMAELHGQMRIL